MAKKSQQEKMEQFKLWLKKNANRIFLIVMALVLGGRLYLWWNESNFRVNEADKAKPNLIPSIPTKLEESNFSIKLVTKMLGGMPEFTTTTYYALSQINMFDHRTVSTADSLISQARQLCAQADAAYKAGNMAEAQRLLKEAYLKNPSTAEVLKLREDMKKGPYVQNTPTSSTAAVK